MKFNFFAVYGSIYKCFTILEWEYYFQSYFKGIFEIFKDKTKIRIFYLRLTSRWYHCLHVKMDSLNFFFESVLPCLHILWAVSINFFEFNPQVSNRRSVSSDSTFGLIRDLWRVPEQTWWKTSTIWCQNRASWSTCLGLLLFKL